MSTVRKEIKLTSPEGNEYFALWKGDERSGEKKLGLFDPPNVRGTIVQDLDTKSIQYPLTIYFQGLNHHEEADAFFKSCHNEKGQWTVVHPVRGTLKLQLVSYKENIQPTESANFTQFDLTMFEPANIETIVSTQESITQTLVAALNTIQDGVDQLKQLRSDLYAAIQSGINTINQMSGLATNAFAEISSRDSVVNDAWLSIKSEVNSLRDKYQSDAKDAENLADLGQAIVDMITIPLESNDDFTTRFSTYSDYADEIINISPTSNTTEDYNRVIFQELGITAILIAICRIIVSSNYTVRSEIIAAMDKLTTIFNDTIQELENTQSLFDDLDIDLQYFSQSACYTSLQNLFALTMQYLLGQFFSLKTEKLFTLKKARAPLEITVTEYGSLGEDDSNYDLFIKSNNLYGKDILLIPSGREVVIYA